MKFINSISCFFITFASKTPKSKIAQVEFTFMKPMNTHVTGGASLYKSHSFGRLQYAPPHAGLLCICFMNDIEFFLYLACYMTGARSLV